MPLLSQLDFCRSGLSIRYQASDRPQALFVEVIVDGTPAQPFANWAMQCVLDTVNFGGGGGDIFSPAECSLEMIAGPLSPEEALRSTYAWELKAKAICPGFMRNVVEELRRAGFDRSPLTMSIRGEIPTDGSEMSVTERKVLGWLDDPRAYPAAWPKPPFPLNVVSKGDSGVEADIRMVVGAPIDPALRTDLEFFVLRWLNAIRNYVAEDGEEVLFNPNRMRPTFGQSRTEFRAYFPYFVYGSDAARAMLINMMTRLHHDRVPVLEAEIGL